MHVERGTVAVRKRGITTDQPVSTELRDAPRGLARGSAPPQEQASSGTERRPLVKAPATPTAKNKKPAPSAGKVRNSPVAAATPLTVKAAAKPASKAVAGKSVPAKKAVPVKKPAQVSKTTVVKAAPKPAAKAVVQKAPAKAAPRAPAPPAKSAAKSGTKAPVVVKPKPTPLPAVKTGKPASPSGATKPVAVPKPAPIVVEPTPRPLGKRAAKKVMMEQMTQAAVVPTHAPDAAKATFFTSNERVMTPPVPSSIQKDPKRANNWKSMSVEQLTDQDVQAMPDAEYMNDIQLAFFRRKLTLLKDDMLANAGETTEHLREDTVVVPDPADRATIEEEHALELRTRDRERKLLKKIEQAITRIDSGDYGYCEETGEAIGVGRLMARPTASLSLEAQQRRELKQKMFGD
ncbi:MAG: RNA polymerase-binding protein DksA [Hydrogenophaga sp.]|nr:RNA polymerase-binding protein DksA [Hydrogenophaga sp.]